MSKELEALKGIKRAIAEHLHKQTGVSVEKHFGYLQNDTEICIVEQALTELEELKRDVNRFIELLMKDNHTGRDTFDIEILKDKLMKVGNEE